MYIHTYYTYKNLYIQIFYKSISSLSKKVYLIISTLYTAIYLNHHKIAEEDITTDKHVEERWILYDIWKLQDRGVHTDVHTLKTRGSKVREHPSSTCSARCAHRKSRPLKWTHTRYARARAPVEIRELTQTRRIHPETWFLCLVEYPPSSIAINILSVFALISAWIAEVIR